MTGRRRLALDIGTVSLINGLAQVAFLGASVILGRTLTAADFGAANLANLIMNLGGYVGVFGMNLAMIRRVPRAELERYDWPAALGKLAALSWLVAIGAGLFAALVYDFTPLQATLIALAVAGMSQSIASGSLLAIERRFALSQIVQSLWRPAILVGSLALLLAHRLSLTALLAVYAAVTLTQVVVGRQALARVARGTEPLPLGRMIREGAIFFGLFLTSTLMLRLDAFLLAGLVDKAALGRYSAAGNIALTGYGVLALGVSQVVAPRLSSGEGLRLRRLMAILVLLGGGGGLLLTLIGSPLIHLLYNHRFPGDFTPLLALFSLAGVVQVAYVVPSAWLGVRAPAKALTQFLLINLVSVGINLGLNLFLIPRYGLTGAATATLLSWLWRFGWAVGLAATLWRAGRSQTGAAGPESAEVTSLGV